MKDNLSDEFLYKHIPRAETAALESHPAENELDHTFSGGFLRKMKALMKYERRGSFARNTAQFGWIAVAALVCVILLNMIPVVNVPATAELIPVVPPYIPEDFEIIEQFRDIRGFTIRYKNDKGQEIAYSQSIVTFGEDHFSTEDETVEIVQINDCNVYIVAENTTIQVLWCDESYKFEIISTTDFDIVIKIAEEIINK